MTSPARAVISRTYWPYFSSVRISIGTGKLFSVRIAWQQHMRQVQVERKRVRRKKVRRELALTVSPGDGGEAAVAGVGVGQLPRHHNAAAVNLPVAARRREQPHSTQEARRHKSSHGRGVSLT